MAKRFFDTQRIDQDWYLALTLKERELLRYCESKADGAGIFPFSERVASMYVGVKITFKDLENLPVGKLENGNFFIEGYCYLQNGKLATTCNPHKTIFKILENNKTTEKELLGSLPNTLPVRVQEKEIYIEQGIEKEKQGVQGDKFVKPTITEICQYFADQNFDGIIQDEANKFFDYYTSNGWKVGKNPMKDWQAAVRNWIKNNSQYNSNKNGTFKTGQSDREQRNNEVEELRKRVVAAKSAISSSPEYLSPTGS